MAVSGKTTTTNPSSTLHPPYLQMISEAISSLKDRTGSSQPAIAKFMEEKYSSLLPPNFKKMLSIQLKKFVKSEKLVKIKNSYKVSASENVKLVAAADASIKESEKKKTDKAVVKKNGEKTKRLSQVKTPEALKKKKKVSTPEMENTQIGGRKSQTGERGFRSWRRMGRSGPDDEGEGVPILEEGVSILEEKGRLGSDPVLRWVSALFNFGHGGEHTVRMRGR